MAEDTLETELKTPPVTHRARPPRPLNPEAFEKAIESGKKRGTLPSKEISPLSPEPAPPFPTKKLWPSEEKQTQALTSIPYTEETIPIEVKEELAEAARKVNIRPMTESVEPKGGTAPLKRILEAEKETEEIRQGPTVEKTVAGIYGRASRIPEEAKEYKPASLQKKEPFRPPTPKTPSLPPETPMAAPRVSIIRKILDKLGRI